MRGSMHEHGIEGDDAVADDTVACLNVCIWAYVQQHNARLGPLLMEGTLVEWLLKTERDEALEALLHYRPGS